MSQQGLRQASVRAESGTTLTYEGDWHALWDGQGIEEGTFNERMLLYCGEKLGVTFTNINDAMQALALDQGATNFGSLGDFDASIGPGTGAGELLGSETDGLAFSAADDTMEIRDTVTPANNYVGSTITKFGSVRASAGTYYNSGGLIASSASGLRRNYNPALSNTPEYLIEETQTNFILYSQEFDNAYWTPSSMTVTANAAVAPDGTTTAANVVPTAGAASHRLIHTTLSHGTAIWTYSLFAKPNGYSQLGFRENYASGASLSVTLTGSGTVGTITPAGLTIIARVVALLNGWYRVVFTASSAPVNTNIAIYVLNGSYVSGDLFGYSFSADGTSGMYLWGAQLENGNGSSYIPTTSATVTRAADIPSIATTAFNYSTANVTLYAKYNLMSNAGTAQTLFSQDVRAFDIFCNLGTPTLFQTSLGSCIALSTPAVGTVNKVAAAGAVNDFALSLNGAAVVVDATTSAMLAVTSLTPGSRASANQLNGGMQEGMHLPRRMTNPELVTKATP